MIELLLALALLAALVGVWVLLRGRARRFSTPRELLLPKSFHKVLSESRHDVLEDLRTLYQQTGQDVSVGLALGTLLRKEGQLKNALRLHQSLLNRPQLDPQVRSFVLAELSADFLASGLLDRARQSLEEARRLAVPDRVFCQHAMRVYFRLKAWDEAYDVVESFFVGTSAEKREKLGQVRHEQGQDLWEDERYSDAKAAFEKAIRIDPDCIPAYLKLSEYHRLMDKPQKALRFLIKHKSRFADHFWLWIKELRKIATQLDDYILFIDEADERLAQVEDDWRTRCVLARAMMQLGEYDDAFAQLTRCLQQAPEVLMVHQAIWELIQRTPAPADMMAAYMQIVRGNLVFRHPYECVRCGFSSPGIMWRCPSCDATRTFYERKV